jgi:hypothetical protein
VPTKAIRIALESKEDPSLNFDFFLAERLHKTVGEIRRMPALEWHTWAVHFGIKAQAAELQQKGGG